MHLYVLTRGQPHETQKWQEDLEAQYFPLNLKDASLVHGNKEEAEKNIKAGIPSYLQLIVKPIQLYEIVFPKEHRDEVLKTIFKNNKNIETSILAKIAYVVRKFLGFKSIEPFNENSNWRPVRDLISVYPIGIKEDKEIDGQEYI